MFQMCRFIDEIVDSVYSRRDLLQSVDHSAIETMMLSLYDGHSSIHCDSPVQSGARDAATAQRGSSSVPAGSDGGPSVMSHLTAHSTVWSGAETQAANRQQSQSRNSSVNGFTSQLTVLLVPLSDFLAQHLAMLQTWLSCTSYGHLVASLCRHIAQVDLTDSLTSSLAVVVHQNITSAKEIVYIILVLSIFCPGTELLEKLWMHLS